MKINNSNETHCAYNNFRKARYFDGEILDKNTFDAEQKYHNNKRKLLNRMLHGWGVVCGLKVKATNPPSSYIIVEPGLALDCQGNEIFVCEEQTIDLSSKTCIQKTEKNLCSEESSASNDTALYVVIKYDEINSDLVPSYAPSGNGNCSEKTCDYSRTHEGFCIEVWDKLPSTPSQPNMDIQCSEPFKCPTCCPDPQYIVLATIRCGERTERVFTSRTSSSSEGSQLEIGYQIKRVFNKKVCLNNRNTTDKINVDDIYQFRTDQTLIGTLWEVSWPKQQPEDKIKIANSTEDPSTNILKINYDVSSLTSAKGSVDMAIPVDLTLTDQKNEVYKFRLSLQSSIYIGNTEATFGSVISDIMIRNMENRQLVVTPPFLSWLLNYSGSKEGQLLSSSMNSICESLDTLFYKPNTDITSLEKKLMESRNEMVNLKSAVEGMKTSGESEK